MTQTGSAALRIGCFGDRWVVQLTLSVCLCHEFGSPRKLVVESQVQQRGIEGTKQILVKLMEGVDCAPDSKIFVFDLVPNRLELSLRVGLSSGSCFCVECGV